VLRLVPSPKINREELTISLDEFRLLTLINGERTLPDIIGMSPVGEFPTCRAIYKLVINKLVEVIGKKEGEEETVEDDEETVFSIVFYLYNNSFYRIRSLTEEFLGEHNTRFPSFASQYRNGIGSFFPGVDPRSDLMPSFDRFLAAVRAVPEPIRLHKLMTILQKMLSEQLVYLFQLLGDGPFRGALSKVKKEISEPLARHRDLVKRFELEDGFYGTLKQADKIVKMVRG
jgi:hypothetical protein